MREPNEDLLALIRGALAVREASLVIHRHGTLVEFKTDRLGPGLTLYKEGNHASWQFGDFDDHHCHLDVGKCSEVVFGAERVSCQGGRLNYTVWFMVDRNCGNPYRPKAYFSVTLNRPYDADGALRREIVEPIFRLYRRFEGLPFVSAEETFLQAISEAELASAAA